MILLSAAGGRTQGMTISIRTARPAEYADVGELTVAVYVNAGFVTPDDWYVTHLRDAAKRGTEAELLVAVDETGRLVGSVTYTGHDGTFAELAGPGEAEFRMLVVDPGVRKQGIGRALVEACVERARRDGCGIVRLSSDQRMTDAHRLYERLGFVRTPERDWEPLPGHHLLAYALELNRR